jgi:hypothetical protein
VSGGKDIVNRIWNIMECKLIHAEIPEGIVGGCAMNALLGVFVSAIVTKLQFVSFWRWKH